MSHKKSQPLDHITVVSLEHAIAAPFCTRQLADLGARVIKIERPGVGDETQAVDNIITKKPEVVHTFGWYLRKMIADTKAKGATPIVLSLTIRNIWKDGKLEPTSLHSQWSAETAAATGTAFFDLSTAVAAQFEKIGAEKTREAFELVEGVLLVKRGGVALEGMGCAEDAGAAAGRFLGPAGMGSRIGAQEELGIAAGGRCP